MISVTIKEISLAVNLSPTGKTFYLLSFFSEKAR
jgi:hypothetical protein